MINLAVTQLCLYRLEVEPGLGFQVHRVSRLGDSRSSTSSAFLSDFGQRTRTLHIWGVCIKIYVYGVSVGRQDRVKGEKNKHLEGVVIQGEFFCFRMKHAVVLSVGPER